MQKYKVTQFYETRFTVISGNMQGCANHKARSLHNQITTYKERWQIQRQWRLERIQFAQAVDKKIVLNTNIKKIQTLPVLPQLQTEDLLHSWWLHPIVQRHDCSDNNLVHNCTPLSQDHLQNLITQHQLHTAKSQYYPQQFALPYNTRCTTTVVTQALPQLQYWTGIALTTNNLHTSWTYESWSIKLIQLVFATWK